MKLKKPLFAAIALLCLLGSGSIAVAQGTGAGQDRTAAQGKASAKADKGKIITIKGVVRDASGMVLPGAAILETGSSTNYTATDDKGEFTLKIGENSSFDVMFSGMQTRNVQVGGRTSFSVVLVEELQSIRSAVVTGYGTIAQESYTGSAVTVSASSFEDRSIGIFEEAVRDNVVGALAVTAGQPGDPGEILLRGFSSLESSNQPLFVIDGVVWDQENNSGSDNIMDNPLSALNSSDIESFTVLKDAASAALYGSRGANGVIVITTKKGKLGEKMSIRLRTLNGVTIMRNQPNLVNGDEYAELWVEGEMHRNIHDVISLVTSSSTTARRMLVEELRNLYADKTGYKFDGKNFYAWQKEAQQEFNTYYVMPAPNGSYTYYDYFGDDHAKLPNTDWYKAISRIAPYTNNSLQISGGFENISYFASLEYLNQQGSIKNSSLERYAIRMKLNQDSKKKKLNWGINSYLVHSIQEGPLYGGGLYASPMYAANVIPPVVPAYLEDGSYNLMFPGNLLNSNNNPLAGAEEFDNRRPALTIQLSGTANYKFNKWLSWNNQIALRWQQTHRISYYSSSFGTGYGVDGRLNERYYEETKLTGKSLFHIDRTFNRNHNIKVTAGGEVENRESGIRDLTAVGFASDNFRYINGSSTIGDYTGGGTAFALVSALGTATYTYKKRYILGASYRTDWSSKFSPDNRLGQFWSISAGYDISREKFMSRFRRQINQLKFKGSYGVNGNQPSATTYWREVYNVVRYDGEVGVHSDYRHRPDLHWEGNRIWNVGVDGSIFSDRFTFTLEYFQRKSSELLRYQMVSNTSGYATMLRNTDAGIDNRGWEFSIRGDVIRKKKFKWNMRFNIATLSSIYYGLDDSYLDGYQRQVTANGLNVHTWYYKEYAGINEATGQALYKRVDENGKSYVSTSSGAYKYDKQGVPKAYGAIQNTLRYGRFNFFTSFTYGLGHYLYDQIGASYHRNDGSRTVVMSKEMLDRWTPDHTKASNPLRINAQSRATNTTRYLYKGDYLKLKTARLMYDTPKVFNKKLKITAASVYVQGENIGQLCALKNYDPELSHSGYRHVDRYPTAATYTLGVVVKF